MPWLIKILIWVQEALKNIIYKMIETSQSLRRCFLGAWEKQGKTITCMGIFFNFYWNLVNYFFCSSFLAHLGHFNSSLHFMQAFLIKQSPSHLFWPCWSGLQPSFQVRAWPWPVVIQFCIIQFRPCSSVEWLRKRNFL